MRILVLFYPSPVSVKDLKLSLMEYGINNQADTSKHLFYLEDKCYLTCSEGFVSEFNDDNLVTITAKGIDLVEGTIGDDGLYL